MDLGEMAEALTRDVLRDDGLNAQEVLNALRYIHRQVQKNFNWRAMEARRTSTEAGNTAIPYAANLHGGVVVETKAGAADCKRIRNVWVEETVGAATNLHEILATSERDSAKLRFCSMLTRPYRWHEARLKLVLVPAPAKATNLTVDFYAYRPFYPAADGNPDENTSDWFSENMPEVLQFGAAAYICTNILEDSRAAKFEGDFGRLLAMAQATDSESKQGGISTCYSPPVGGPPAWMSGGGNE